jgi:hypothetical protein
VSRTVKVSLPIKSVVVLLVLAREGRIQVTHKATGVVSYPLCPTVGSVPPVLFQVVPVHHLSALRERMRSRLRRSSRPTGLVLGLGGVTGRSLPLDKLRFVASGLVLAGTLARCARWLTVRSLRFRLWLGLRLRLGRSAHPAVDLLYRLRLRLGLSLYLFRLGYSVTLGIKRRHYAPP